ncbi:MAG: GNAT family N-acetyltransferase [Planctomycetota bacterium]|jgi:GNAT superfamily N-acetyltransferase
MSDSSEVFITRTGPQDAALVGEILADAFGADPVGKWISPNSEYSKWCWPVIVPLLLPYGEVYMTGNGMGAAIWIPPGVKPDIKLGLTLLWDYWRRFGLRSILRFFRLMIAMEKHHPKEPHYYLLAIGVRPEATGQGIGSALLEHVLRECDRRKVVAYLENSNPLNLPLYQRHGFEVRSEITVGRDGPTLWLMYREPIPGRV